MKLYDRLFLLRATEVDEHVAAKDDVVRRQPGKKEVMEQIAVTEGNHALDGITEHKTFASLGEVFGLIVAFVAAKRVRSVHGPFRAIERAHANIDGVDAHRIGRVTYLLQNHRDRIGFFTSGAWQTQNAQRLYLGRRKPFSTNDVAKHEERFFITKKPGFRHGNRIDQTLQLARVTIQFLEIFIEVLRAGYPHALHYGALHGIVAE